MSATAFRCPPVLCYHSLLVDGDAERGAAGFDAQMSHLARAGFHTLTPDEFVSATSAGRWPKKSIFITFDDGYTDFHDIGFPTLTRHGLTATVFLMSDVLAGGLDAFVGPHPASTPPTMGWGEVREMQGRGVHFGSHGTDHRFLTRMPADEAAAEIRRSKAELEEGLGAPVEVFAYPYGASCGHVRDAVRDAGYAIGLGLNPVEPGPYDVPRREVSADQSTFEFGLRASSAFPLLHRGSRLLKHGTLGDPDECR